jgi:phage-related protein
MASVKPIDFHPRALEFIRAQSASIRCQIGEALRDIQKGVNLGMPLSRPMPVVAPGVSELRAKDEGATARVFYLTSTPDAILVFHGFQKKSQKTPAREIDLARRRLREVLNAKIES